MLILEFSHVENILLSQVYDQVSYPFQTIIILLKKQIQCAYYRIHY